MWPARAAGVNERRESREHEERRQGHEERRDRTEEHWDGRTPRSRGNASERSPHGASRGRVSTRSGCRRSRYRWWPYYARDGARASVGVAGGARRSRAPPARRAAERRATEAPPARWYTRSVLVSDLIALIDRLAPFQLAEPWDRVGLQVGGAEERQVGQSCWSRSKPHRRRPLTRPPVSAARRPAPGAPPAPLRAARHPHRRHAGRGAVVLRAAHEGTARRRVPHQPRQGGRRPGRHR